ncbi:39S ribosomal protein S30, mitochondrial [Agrilus planipennis]|uniref:39S ribosomal protein S30, mitochondrial n=1 Tax=Agrilus planipennis TaxID=224129 RepID=A0A1W4WMJ6_AGRPL|nr:39S ribosomal protein S30, mitochondrial [Agrilus planipennis]
MLARVPKEITRRLVLSVGRLSTATEVIETEYTETPQYPPILNLSPEKKLERKKDAYYEEIKKVKTVEEKQIKLNMPRYYGFKCYMLEEERIPYNNLAFTQHITRTHIIHQNNLPSYYDTINIDSSIPDIKEDIEEALILEHEGYMKSHEIKREDFTLEKGELEKIYSKNIIYQINRILLNSLNSNYPHIINSQVDIEPRIESFWYAGGMNPPNSVRKGRLGREWTKHQENDPVDRAMQYIGVPSLTVRSSFPLAPIISSSEAENPALDVPFFQYDPRTVGTHCSYRRITNIPGFWPGESHQFGTISYNLRGHLLEKQYKDPNYTREALHRQGILGSFGWLNAQANNLGFTTYNDITYPLTTQCVITNGKLWSFYVYQLNTILIHSKHVHENPKRNVCWSTDSIKLFDEVKDGKVIGFNEDVLKMLVKFYANQPVVSGNLEDFRPFLSNKEKVVADYEDPDKRKWLEKEFKFIVSNRPRHRLPYEIYHWEKIYKIDHKTRPMDKRSRPFELFQNPWKRTYDNRQPPYIPRKLRPDLPRHKGRYAKEYFP